MYKYIQNKVCISIHSAYSPLLVIIVFFYLYAIIRWRGRVQHHHTAIPEPRPSLFSDVKPELQADAIVANECRDCMNFCICKCYYYLDYYRWLYSAERFRSAFTYFVSHPQGAYTLRPPPTPHIHIRHLRLGEGWATPCCMYRGREQKVNLISVLLLLLNLPGGRGLAVL